MYSLARPEPQSRREKERERERGRILCDTFNLLRGHVVQTLQRVLEVYHQTIAPCTGEILPHHHPHELQLFAVGGHCICRHHPPALTEVMCHVELVVLKLLFFRIIEAESHEREAFSVAFAQDDESQVSEAGGKIVSRAGQVLHNELKAVFSEANQLVILADDLGRAFRKIEGKGGLIGPEVVDVEDEFFGEKFGRAPDTPAHAGVHLGAYQ